jgi:hypothetical protein
MTTADTLRTITARLIGYQTQGHGFNKVHHSLTLRNALQWAACYDRATVTRHGRFIATKTTGTKP